MMLYVMASPSLSVAEIVTPVTVVSAAEFSLTVPVYVDEPKVGGAPRKRNEMKLTS